MAHHVRGEEGLQSAVVKTFIQQICTHPHAHAHTHTAHVLRKHPYKLILYAEPFVFQVAIQKFKDQDI